LKSLKIFFTLVFVIYFNDLTAQYNVVKVDVVSLAAFQFFHPSFERSFGNFSAGISYENGIYDKGTVADANGFEEDVYKIKGWGICPEIRYYPFHKIKLPPFGFFFGPYYTYRSAEEHYNDKGLNVKTKVNSWNAGLCTGYKSSFGGRIIFEALVGGGMAGGKFDEPNNRIMIDPFYKVDDLDAFNRSIRAEISIGIIFPKQKIIPKTVSNPVALTPELSTGQITSVILYHPAKTLGADYAYDVYIDSSLVYNAAWGTADTIQVEHGKELVVWAGKIDNESLRFIPEKGKMYFIRCSFKNDVVVNKPVLEFIEPDKAQKDLSKIKED
jgi:hypothetical protein